MSLLKLKTLLKKICIISNFDSWQKENFLPESLYKNLKSYCLIKKKIECIPLVDDYQGQNH